MIEALLFVGLFVVTLRALRGWAMPPHVAIRGHGTIVVAAAGAAFPPGSYVAVYGLASPRFMRVVGQDGDVLTIENE